jgi:ABC-type nitrate/sulfonate/bicarbonate transport system substrate-binding protein
LDRAFARARATYLAALVLTSLVLLACGGSSEPATGATSSATVSGTASSATATPEPASLTFMAGFSPQANLPFVGVYVAKSRGFFAEEGLEVDVRHSSGQDEHLRLLLEGRVDVTTGTAAQVLRRREQGLPVQAVALFGQRGDQGYVARADSGIRTPADFRGKSIGFKAGVVPAELLALLRGAGLSEDDVRLQGVGFDPRAFIEGQVDVYPVFLSNEPDTIRRAGVDINVIDPTDFGVPTLGVTYLVTDSFVSEQPEVAQRFLRASMRGAEYARDHIDEAVAITLEYAPGADAAHQRYMLETDLRNAQRADGMGRFTLAQWERLQDTLLEFKVMERRIEVATAANATLLDGVYATGGLR